MEQNVETATSYYNDKRKRSFFLSRIFVIVSMVVLVAALGVNISVLYQQQRTSTTSEASSANKQANLPDLPKGCEYQSKGKGVIVVCPTATPEAIQSAAPTVSSKSYTSCVPGSQKDTLSCVDEKNQTEVVPLPSLPAGCLYKLTGRNYIIDCNATQSVN